MSTRYLDLARQALRDRPRLGTPAPAPEPKVIVLPPDRPRRAIPENVSACPACHGTDFWISLALVRVCERCHPPCTEKVVARWEKTPATFGQDARSPDGQAPAIPPDAAPSGGIT